MCRLQRTGLVVSARITVSTEAFFNSGSIAWLHHLRMRNLHLKRKYSTAGSDAESHMAPMLEDMEAWFVQRDCAGIHEIHYKNDTDMNVINTLGNIASLIFVAVPADTRVRSYTKREKASLRGFRQHFFTVDHAHERSEISETMTATGGSEVESFDERDLEEFFESKTVIQNGSVLQVVHGSKASMGTNATQEWHEIQKDLSMHASGTASFRQMFQTEGSQVRKLWGNHWITSDDGRLGFLISKPFQLPFHIEKPLSAIHVCNAHVQHAPESISCQQGKTNGLEQCMQCLMACLEAQDLRWNETTKCLAGLIKLAEANNEGQFEFFESVLDQNKLDAKLSEPSCPNSTQIVIHALAVAGVKEGQSILLRFLENKDALEHHPWVLCIHDLLIHLHRVAVPSPELIHAVIHLAYPGYASPHNLGSQSLREASALAPAATLVLGTFGRNLARSESHPDLQGLIRSSLRNNLKMLAFSHERGRRKLEMFKTMATQEFENCLPHTKQRYLAHTKHWHGSEFVEAWEACSEEEKNLWRNETIKWISLEVISSFWNACLTLDICLKPDYNCNILLFSRNCGSKYECRIADIESFMYVYTVGKICHHSAALLLFFAF
jgi:hypothetical protein